MQNKEPFVCPICERITPIEFQENHHLIPKQLRGREKEIVCCDCHDMIHEIFTNRQLAKHYNRIHIIKSDKRIQKWAEWIQKKEFRFKINMAKKKRKRK